MSKLSPLYRIVYTISEDRMFLCVHICICILSLFCLRLYPIVGHSKPVTGLQFLRDGRHLVTVSADSCIFVWRLSSSLSDAIDKKAKDLGKNPRYCPYFRTIFASMRGSIWLFMTCRHVGGGTLFDKFSSIKPAIL